MATIRIRANRGSTPRPIGSIAASRHYRTHHPAFLPPAFSGFTVEEGGVGPGTVIHFTLKAGGRTQTFRQRVSEPDPGRVLTETTIGTQNNTTFTVTPRGLRKNVRDHDRVRGDHGPEWDDRAVPRAAAPAPPLQGRAAATGHLHLDESDLSRPHWLVMAIAGPVPDADRPPAARRSRESR